MYLSYSEREEINKKIPTELQDIFKHYSHYLIKVLKLRDEKQNLLYEMSNVKAVDNTRVRVAYNKDAAIERYYKQSEQLEQIEQELAIYKSYTKGIKTVLNLIKDKETKDNIYKVYFNDTEELAQEVGYKA